MKEKINKQEKGITLIALVITIIVLLILAGVAISMLSGENGILTRAVEAKEKTEEAQKEEETGLASMDLETYFITNNLKYKCAYGYVTGIAIGEKVSELQTDLQAGGYELKAIDETDNFTAKNSEEEYIVTTGMQIQKDGKEVARTVIFGDVSCDGKVTTTDFSTIGNSFIGKKLNDYQKVAANVNEDEEINILDKQIIEDALTGGIASDVINKQNGKVVPANKLKRNYKKMQELIENMKEDSPYSWEYNEKEDEYTLKGVEAKTTVGTLKENLPEGYEYLVFKGLKKLSDTDEIENSSSLRIKLEYKIIRTGVDEDTGEEYQEEEIIEGMAAANIEVK